jgi:predicted Rossmann fold flavoprotein
LAALRPPDLVIVGAGAAGLWCAARAAELGRRVLLLEKTPRAGTKVLASGGTHCNLTTTLGPAEAARLFGPRGERFLKHGFRVLPPRAVRERFHALGVPTVEAPWEKIFPASGRARDVRDALVAWALEGGVEIRYEQAVRALRRDGAAWRVDIEGAGSIVAPQVVLALGGRSYAKTGTTGDAYPWLESLGLRLVRPVPALVPLVSGASWVQELAGIALEEAVVRLVSAEGRVLAERTRPALFTHLGLSGPGPMDLSEPFARAEEEGRACEAELTIDVCASRSHEDLRERMLAAAARPGGPLLAKALELDAPRRVLEAAFAQAGIAPDTRANALAKPARHALAVALKSLHIPIEGTRGFDHAEVTAGGLDLSEVDPGTCRVRGAPDLHVVGELLDLQGPIGGLNFQAAFATAEVAAHAVKPI